MIIKRCIYIILYSLIIYNIFFMQTSAEDYLSKEEIEKIIHEYIMKNPEIILKSVDNLRKEMEKSSVENDNYLKKEFQNFANQDYIPSFGNKDAKVIIIEFVDYNCGYCKKSLDAIIALLESNLDLKISFRDYPILSPTSRLAAKAVLAAHYQNKYFELHAKLLSMRGGLTEEIILKIAKNIEIDVNKLKVDMQNPKIDLIIQENESLARKLNIRGTPTFIINGKLYAGALELDKFKTIINKALSKKVN